jgi:hypothetical protein
MLPMYQWIFHSGRDRMVVGFTTTYTMENPLIHWQHSAQDTEERQTKKKRNKEK